MNDNSLNVKLKVLAIWTLIIFILYTVLNICTYFMSLVTMLGFSIIITYILLEPVNFLEKYLPRFPKSISIAKKEINISNFVKHFNRKVISIFVIYISFIALIIFLAIQLIPPTAQQVIEFASNIPNYAKMAERELDNTINYINKKFPQLNIKGISEVPTDKYLNTAIDKEQTTSIDNKSTDNENLETKNTLQSSSNVDYKNKCNSITPEQVSQIKNSLFQKVSTEIITIAQNNAAFAFNNILSAASNSLTAIGYVITVFVLSFYFLLDGRNLISKLNLLVPEKNKSAVLEIEGNIHNSLLGFLKGQVLLGILTGLFMWPVYTFFGVNYAIFLCIFLAVAEILPVIGSSIGFIPAIIVILFTHPVDLIPIWIIFFLFQNVKDNIVAPKIVGDIIGLHPVTVIISLWVGYKVAGFFGILFAIPAASIINVIIAFIIHRSNSSPKNTA